MKISIKKLNPKAVLPGYQTEQSAAMDLHAAIDEPIILRPMERRVVPSGIAIALPDGYEAQIRARSGLSLNHGIALANGIGTIDADYRGEIGVILINLNDVPYTIQPSDRIAQMVISKFEKVQWNESDSLDTTERGEGGYGSTG